MLDFYDNKLELNEQIFDKQELFDTIEEFLYKNKYPIDDLKANISYSENEGFSDIPGDFSIHCKFSWIVYNNDIPPKQFKELALKIEQDFESAFSAATEVECYRYRGNSEYANNGYDVELKLYLSYPLKETSYN